jgi:hypothetical protein
MYLGLLHLHNVLRWVVLIAALLALINAYTGWFSGRAFARRDRTLGAVFTGSLDLQLLIGVVLYLVSPLVQGALGNMSAAMGTRELRFFALEHASIMLLAVILAHVGGVMARRAAGDTAKFRQQAVWFTLSALAIVFAVPWWRPLFPGL